MKSDLEDDEAQLADYIINELGRSNQGLEEDTVLLEGVRDLNDLDSLQEQLLHLRWHRWRLIIASLGWMIVLGHLVR